ncbi:hypothetical protein ABKN59_007364 [Abortiporus biennis]
METMGKGQSSRPTHLTLHYDLLVHIMSFFSSRRELLPFAMTCHALYHDSIRYMLGFPVMFLSTKRLSSFCQFMLADFTRRCHFLQHLEFCFESWDELNKRTLEDLTNIISNAQNLVSLDFLDIQGLLHFAPAMSDAIASLPRLADLGIVGTYWNAFPMLRNISAPIQKLRVTFEPGVLESDSLEPLDLLESMSQTVRKLTLGFCSIRPSPSRLNYPKVEELVLDYPRELHTLPIFESFPALRILHIDNFDNDLDEIDLNNMRSLNQAMIGQAGRCPTLFEVSGDVNAHFALGLKNVIHARVISIDNDNVRMMPVILGSMTPFMLSLDIALSGMDPAELTSLIPPAIGSRLCQVSLNLDFGRLRGVYEDVDVQKVVESLYTLSSALVSVVSIRVSIGWDFKLDPPVRSALQEINQKEVASEFMYRTQSLSTVYIDLGQGNPQAWRIHASTEDGDRTSHTMTAFSRDIVSSFRFMDLKRIYLQQPNEKNRITQ